MIFKSNKAKEKHLNALYFDVWTEDEAVDNLIYLTNKTRSGGHTTVNGIRSAYRRRELGTLLRKLDPILFNSWNQ